MPWQPRKLRDDDVWAKVDDAGELVLDKEGRVEVVYKAAAGAKIYRAAGRNLAPRDGATVDFEAGESAPDRAKKNAPAARAIPDGAIQVWTDGGCAPNPGPGGVGVVVIEDGQRRELSEWMGDSTNNICELTAILRGLEMVSDRTRTVLVHSDSQYALGLLGQNWKAKANVELVAQLRAVAKTFKDVRWIKVLAHSGVPDNERCDRLATEAREFRKTRRM